MGLSILTNISSLMAQRQLTRIQGEIAKSFRRLSTGLRITTAADDPAGLAMSERLRASVRSMLQEQRNAQDGVSLVQTAEGGLNEVSSMLLRLRELAVQSANGTTSDNDRDTLQAEFAQLVSEVDRISRSTEFNGIGLLDGSRSSVTIVAGGSLSVILTPTLATSLGLASLDIGAGGDVNGALTGLDAAVDQVSATRGRLGAVQNRLASTIRNLASQAENLTAAESRIRDVDVAYEMANLTRNQILQQATIAVLAQANLMPQALLSLITAATRRS